ncbi:hypothetical protein GCM10009595_16550 [Falsarthrobacter nasiphocae]
MIAGMIGLPPVESETVQTSVKTIARPKKTSYFLFMMTFYRDPGVGGVSVRQGIDVYIYTGVGRSMKSCARASGAAPGREGVCSPRISGADFVITCHGTRVQCGQRWPAFFWAVKHQVRVLFSVKTGHRALKIIRTTEWEFVR